MEENKKRRTTGLLLSILGVLSLVLITAGVTYAFFNYAKEGQTVNTIRTGTIEFAYNETDGIGNGIQISNAMPTDDLTGASVTSEATEYGKLFRFTVTSKTPTTAKIPYFVTLRKTDGNLGNGQVKVYLESTPDSEEYGAENYTVVSGSVADENIVVNSFATLLEDHLASDETMIGSKATAEEAILYKGEIPANQASTFTNSFVLRMWLSGSDSGEEAADYSPFEFMLKSVANPSGNTASYNVDATCIVGNSSVEAADEAACTAAGGNYVTSLTLPTATVTTAIDAETQISAGKFKTSVQYYALPSATTDDPATGDGTHREDYERIAYVNTETKKVYTISQALANESITGVDAFGNFTFGYVSDYEATEQYYRINGASFTAIVNVYADAEVVNP